MPTLSPFPSAPFRLACLGLAAALPLSLGLPKAEAEETTPGQFPILAATDTDGLKAKDGQKIIVWGKTTGSGKSQSGTNFVNFEDAEFYLITFKSDLAPFKEAEPADAYDDKRLVVTGVVSIYKDKPQFKLTDPEQVKILADDEAWPTAPAAEEKAEAPAETATPKPEATAKTEEPRKKPPVDPKLYFK